MIYLDSSALMKLVRSEEETTALIDWLEQRVLDEPVITSELGRVEVLRTARRLGDDAVTAQVRTVIAEIDLIALDRTVQDLACDIADPPLRTLDALHLASALVIREHLSTFVAYDHRLATAARDADLHVAAPGQAA